MAGPSVSRPAHGPASRRQATDEGGTQGEQPRRKSYEVARPEA